MIDLENAQINIDTRLSEESGCSEGNSFSLADYSSLSELYADCAGWFIWEDNPEYLNISWEGIPDDMINREWISPNIFEVRDILMNLGAEMSDVFLNWCKTYGWNIGHEDPQKMLAEFNCYLDNTSDKSTSVVDTQNSEHVSLKEFINENKFITQVEEAPDLEDIYFMVMPGNGACNEIFGDNYN